jgi:hypothetical protein
MERVISFTLLPLYPYGYLSRVQFCWRIVVPQNRCGLCAENNLTLLGIELCLLNPQSATISTELWSTSIYHPLGELKLEKQMQTCISGPIRNKIRTGEKYSASQNKHYYECCLLGCGAMQVLLELTFERSVSPPYSGFKEYAFYWIAADALSRFLLP